MKRMKSTNKWTNDSTGMILPPISVASSTNAASTNAASKNAASTNAASTNAASTIAATRRSMMWDEGHTNRQREHLQTAVRRAGMLSFGTVCVEVWMMNDERTELFLPEGGFWVDPLYAMLHPTESLAVLMNEDHPDYCEPEPVGPGESIPGILWHESYEALPSSDPIPKSTRGEPKQSVNQINYQIPPSPGIEKNSNRFFSQIRQRDASGRSNTAKNVENPFVSEKGPPIVWKDITRIPFDPSHHSASRCYLQLLAGLKFAAGVKFNIRSHLGTVIYYSAGMNPSTMKVKKSPENIAFLRASTDLIGAIVATHEISIQVHNERKERMKKIFEKVRCRLLAEKHLAIIHHHPEPYPVRSNWKDSLAIYTKRCGGVGKHPPPLGSWYNTIYCFVGCFLQLFILEEVNLQIIKISNGTQKIAAINPFAGVACLFYGLLAGPPAQPNAAILGIITAGVTKMLLIYIPMPKWVAEAFAVSVTGSIMTKGGFGHPPAAAFSAAIRTWADVLILFLVYLICILLAAAVNNLSAKRQYPSYWFRCHDFRHYVKLD